MRFSFVLPYAGLILALTYAHQSAAHEDNLKPFTTDGCSLWIDGPVEQPYLWRHCCVAHDKAYWIGGTSQERKQADEALQACVSDVGGKGMGDYMYFFVGPGGSPFWVTTYRWGYGWNYLEGGKPRGYKTPSAEELLQINTLLPQAEQTIAEDVIKHPVIFKAPEKNKP